MKEQEPSGEMQVELNSLSLEELQTRLNSLQRLSDEGKDMCSTIHFTQKVIQSKIENQVNNQKRFLFDTSKKD